MGIAIEQSFRLEAPKSLVWALLIDPQKIVGCLPGAAITGKLDNQTYEGTMTLKVGPVMATYKGKVRFERIDAAAGETQLAGQGQETKGKGSAEMKMRCRVQGVGAATQVAVSSDLAVTGILAQFGRGMIQEVSDRILQHFTTQMRAVLIRAKVTYGKVVQAHASQFARLYPGKLEELQTAAGFAIKTDGSNGAASPEDVARYLEAVKQIAGDVAHTSALLTIRNLSQRENVPVPAL